MPRRDLDEKDLNNILSVEKKSTDNKAVKAAVIFLTIRGDESIRQFDDEKSILTSILLDLDTKAILISEEQNKKDFGFHLHIIIVYNNRTTIMSTENKIRKALAQTKLKDKYKHDNVLFTKYSNANGKASNKSKEILMSYCTKDFPDIDQALTTNKLIIRDSTDLIFTKEKIIASKEKYPFTHEKTAKADKHIFMEEFLTKNKISIDFENRRFISNNCMLVENYEVNDLLLSFVREKNLLSINLDTVLKNIFTSHKIRYEDFAYRPDKLFTTDKAVIDMNNGRLIPKTNDDYKPIQFLKSEPAPKTDESLLEFYIFNLCNDHVDKIMKLFYNDLYQKYKCYAEKYKLLGNQIESVEESEELPEIKVEKITKKQKFKCKHKDGYENVSSSTINDMKKREEILNSLNSPPDYDEAREIIREFEITRIEYQTKFLKLYNVKEIIELTEDNYNDLIDNDDKAIQLDILKTKGGRLYLIDNLVLPDEFIIVYIKELMLINNKILKARAKIHDIYLDKRNTLWIYSNSEMTRDVFLNLICNFVKLKYTDKEYNKIVDKDNVILKNFKAEKLALEIEKPKHNSIITSEEKITKELDKYCEENKITTTHKNNILKNIHEICLSDEHENISSILLDKLESTDTSFIDSLISNIIRIDNEEEYSLHNVIKLPILPSSITISVY